MVPTVNEKPRPKVPAGFHDSGRNGSGGPGDKGFGGGEPFEPLGWSVPPGAYRIGMWVAMASIFMFFGALSTALLVRESARPGWISFTLPRILYANTAVLILSSVTFELCRKWLTAGLARRFKLCLYVTLALGLTFIAGQVIAWTDLRARGVYMISDPRGACFYVLTAAHGFHLLGGIIALIYLVAQVKYIALGIKRRTALDVTAVYWHFMDGLWILLFGLLIWKL
jgi:cytochrome c oxidase subunit III